MCDSSGAYGGAAGSCVPITDYVPKHRYEPAGNCTLADNERQDGTRCLDS